MTEAIALVCKHCGCNFVLPADMLVFPCIACGTLHSRPRARGEALEHLHRAHQQRTDCDFASAEANYQRVLGEHAEEADALWGLALCKYGVEFIFDEKSGKSLPVIHFFNRKPFTEDPDVRLAISMADEEVRPQYMQDAEFIARIQQQVLAAEQRGESWDVFLCYKASLPGADDPNTHTREYDHARDLYLALHDAGYKVFFAHTTLRRAAGANYEAQIFHALQSARVMLVITAEPSYLNTPWVRSEWSRYLERLDAHEDCRLIPLLYDGCDPYALPREFQLRSLQALTMGTLTSLDDLRHILDSCLHPEKAAAPAKEMPAAPDPLLRRAFLFLEDEAWSQADDYCERVLDANPECALAYVGKLMAALHVPEQGKLADVGRPLDNDPHYRKALRFADDALADELRSVAAAVRERIARLAEEAARHEAEEHELAARTQSSQILAEVRTRLSRGHWNVAQAQLAQALQLCESGEAYLLSLLCEYHIYSPETLVTINLPIETNELWQKALQNATPEIEDIAARRAARLQEQLDQELLLHLSNARSRLTRAQWKAAQQHVARAMSIRESSEVYLLHLLCELHLSFREQLASCPEAFEERTSWQRALQLATPELLAELEAIASEHAAFLQQQAADAQRIAEENTRIQQREQEQRRTIRKTWELLAQGQWNVARKMASYLTESAESHILNMMCDLQLSSLTALVGYEGDFTKVEHWQKALQLAAPEYRTELEGYAHQHAAHIRKKQAAEQEQRRSAACARIEASLQHQDWQAAEHDIPLALNSDPKYGQLWLYWLLTTLKLQNAEQLATHPTRFEDEDAWRNALDHADKALKAQLNSIRQRHQEYLARLERQKAVEAEAARHASAKGRVIFTRRKEMLCGKLPILLFANDQKVTELLGNGEPVRIRIVDDCTITAHTADGISCFKFHAKADMITHIEVHWPWLGKPVFRIISSTPA